MTEEVVEISVIAELRRKSFSLQKIRRILRFLKKDTRKRLSQALSSTSDAMFLVCVTDQARRLSAAAERRPTRSETAAAGRKARVV